MAIVSGDAARLTSACESSLPVAQAIKPEERQRATTEQELRMCDRELTHCTNCGRNFTRQSLSVLSSAQAMSSLQTTFAKSLLSIDSVQYLHDMYLQV